MSNKIKYHLVKANNNEEFIKRVNSKLTDGWILYGNPTVNQFYSDTLCYNTFLYHQAMTKTFYLNETH